MKWHLEHPVVHVTPVRPRSCEHMWNSEGSPWNSAHITPEPTEDHIFIIPIFLNFVLILFP